MLLDSNWVEAFLRRCRQVPGARRQAFAAGKPIYLQAPQGRCWLVATGYVKLIEPRGDGKQFIQLVLGRGNLFGDPPFGRQAFHGFATRRYERAVAHGTAEVVAIDRQQLETAAQTSAELAAQLLESATARTQFLERRLLWQFTHPMRARIATTLRDLICFEGQRCKHGHTIDIRLTHQDLAELVGAARPVVSAEVARLRSEKLLSGTRSHFCIDDLAGLNRVADEH
jgi:CRP-like cAMP-binding protein